MPGRVSVGKGDIVGVLLAAGKGVRFGSDKLLHPLVDGTPMALAAARKLRPACARCVTVLRPGQAELAELLRTEGYTVLFNAEVERGMGHSLAHAVRATPEAAGWIVALADMPFLSTATISRVADALRHGASLAAPFHQGRRGHPVGFSRDWYTALAGLQGDRGARDLLADAPMQRLETDDPGVLLDVDTPEALPHR